MIYAYFGFPRCMMFFPLYCFIVAGQSYHRGANMCLLVFDLSRSESFEALPRWRDEFLASTNNDGKQHKLYMQSKLPYDDIICYSFTDTPLTFDFFFNNFYWRLCVLHGFCMHYRQLSFCLCSQ